MGSLSPRFLKGQKWGGEKKEGKKIESKGGKLEEG